MFAGRPFPLPAEPGHGKPQPNWWGPLCHFLGQPVPENRSTGQPSIPDKREMNTLLVLVFHNTKIDKDLREKKKERKHQQTKPNLKKCCESGENQPLMFCCSSAPRHPAAVGLKSHKGAAVHRAAPRTTPAKQPKRVFASGATGSVRSLCSSRCPKRSVRSEAATSP